MFKGICLYEASCNCLLYTSDAADEEDSVVLCGCRIIKKKKDAQAIVPIAETEDKDEVVR